MIEELLKGISVIFLVLIPLLDAHCTRAIDAKHNDSSHDFGLVVFKNISQIAKIV